MAIDTAQKRASTTRLMFPGYSAIIPSGTIPRPASVWQYTGITISEAATGLFYEIQSLISKYSISSVNSKHNISPLDSKYRIE